jgi:hypothetical protein
MLVGTYLKVVSRNFPGNAEENRNKNQMSNLAQDMLAAQLAQTYTPPQATRNSVALSPRRLKTAKSSKISSQLRTRISKTL